MKNFYHPADKYPVYPGEFIPMIKEKDVDKEYKKRKYRLVTKPLTNITEMKNSFRIEVAVPGVNREDFFIRVNKNVLSVIVWHKKYHGNESGHAQLHEFDADFFERHILLSDKADVQFVRAEYKEGVLRLYLPKTDNPLILKPARIAVY